MDQPFSMRLAAALFVCYRIGPRVKTVVPAITPAVHRLGHDVARLGVVEFDVK